MTTLAPAPGRTVLSAAVLAVLCLAVVNTGAIAPRDDALLASALCAIGCLGCLHLLWRGAALRLNPGSVPLLLLAGLVAIQTIPFGIERTGADRLTTGLSHSASLSLVPAATLSALRGLLGLVVLFFVGATVMAHPRRMPHVAWFLLLVGSVVAISYGLRPFLEVVPEYARDYGVERHVFGTFCNRNHVGSLLTAAMLCGAGLFVARRRTLNPRAPGFRRRQVYIAILVSTCAVGLVRTGSRGAMIGLALGGLALAWWLPRRSGSGNRTLSLVAACALLALLPFVLPDTVLERFQHIGRDVSVPWARPGLWRTATALFATAPVLGTGLGTFGFVSALTQPAAVVGHVEHAHSDPLQWLAETGILGVNALLWAVALVLVHVLGRSRETRGDRRTALAVAFVVALGALLVQASVDYVTQVPALAAVMALLAGTASGAMATANGLPPRGRALPPAAVFPMCLALGLAAVFAAREAIAHHMLATDRPVAALRVHAAQGQADATLATRLAAVEEGPRDLLSIRAHAAAALRRNPFDCRAWHALACASIWSADGAAASTIHRALEVLPPSERQPRRIDYALALLRSGRSRLAARFCRELLADPNVDGVHVLRRIHAELGEDVDLRPLLATGDSDSFFEYAEQLRHRGELEQRERILDIVLGRLPEHGRYTVRDRVTLTNGHVDLVEDTHGRHLRVVITLSAPPNYAFDSQMMCIDLASPHGRVTHYFRPSLGTTHHTVTVPRHLPPGRCDVALQAFTNGTRFPIGFVTLPAEPLHLTPGRTLPAGHAFYREADRAEPTEPLETLSLRPGETLWRRIRLSRGGDTLVLETSVDAAFALSCNGIDLAGEHRPGEFRYRLPDQITEARLEVRPLGTSPMVFHRITLLGREQR